MWLCKHSFIQKQQKVLSNKPAGRDVVDDSHGNISPGTTGCCEGWHGDLHAWVEAGSCFNMTSHVLGSRSS